jgi:hypothetical protein
MTTLFWIDKNNAVCDKRIQSFGDLKTPAIFGEVYTLGTLNNNGGLEQSVLYSVDENCGINSDIRIIALYDTVGIYKDRSLQHRSLLDGSIEQYILVDNQNEIEILFEVLTETDLIPIYYIKQSPNQNFILHVENTHTFNKQLRFFTYDIDTKTKSETYTVNTSLNSLGCYLNINNKGDVMILSFERDDFIFTSLVTNTQRTFEFPNPSSLVNQSLLSDDYLISVFPTHIERFRIPR